MPLTNMSSKKTSNSTKKKLSMPKVTKGGLFRFVSLTVFIGAVVAAGYFYYLYQNVSKNEVAGTIKAVNKLMLLPDTELPTVATVTDKKKLQDQDFFKQAENGDKVLIYEGAKKAILFRPAENRIVDVAPVRTSEANGGEETAVLGEKDAPTGESKKTTPTPTEAESFTLVLFNGTTTSGATEGAESTITNEFEDVNITGKDSADGNEFGKSIVYVATEAAEKTAQAIATELGFEIVRELPDGESTAGADIVVIIGEDAL